MSSAQLFLILYGIFALATPVLVIALYVRYSKLQARVKAAEEESAKQAAALRQEIAELKRQVVAQKAASDQAASERPLAEKAAADAALIEKALSDKAAIEKAAADKAQILKAAAEKAAAEKALAEEAASEKVPAADPGSIPEKTQETPAAPGQREFRPVVLPPPVAVPPPRQEIPTNQPVARKTAEPVSEQKQETAKPELRVEPKPEHRVPAPPPPLAARVSVPALASPLRVPASKPTMRERMNKVSAFEEALGTNWLQKLGIVLLVLGVASFGIYELAALGSFGKVLVSYFASATLLGGAFFLRSASAISCLGGQESVAGGRSCSSRPTRCITSSRCVCCSRWCWIPR